jgi:hypothetical protein
MLNLKTLCVNQIRQKLQPRRLSEKKDSYGLIDAKSTFLALRATITPVKAEIFMNN